MTFIDNRDASIERDLSSTQNHKGNIQRIDEEITQILSSARKEAAQILEVATREAKATYEEKINAKKAENKRNWPNLNRHCRSSKHNFTQSY